MNRTVVEIGTRKVLLMEDFLPDRPRDALAAHVMDRRAAFVASTRTLNDPEYRAASTLDDVGPVGALFVKAVTAAWREVLLSLAMETFTPRRFDLRVSLLRPGAYRKPRAEVLHGEGETKLSLLYTIGRQPKPYEGGDLRFFEYNPYEHRMAKFRRTLEFAAVPNSLVIFPGTLFYALNEIMEGAPGFSGTCFMLDGAIA